MSYLLDTNICVYFLRGNRRIADQIRNVGWENCYVSEITVAELLYGAECSASTKINEATILDFCDCLHVLPISDVIPIFARQKAMLRKKGQIIEDSDMWIAATAVTHDMEMVTENARHLGRLQGVRIEKWER